MRLELTNYRQWDHKVIELPDRGLVRLGGDSEAGKSSIMYAICWALYGNEVTRNVTSIGKKGGSVTLQLPGWESITRAKAPERLSFGPLNDAAAQAVIESRLEMSAEQFLLASFIQQKMKNSLLTLGPADQLRAVQTLAYGKDDPEVYRTKIYARMKSEEEKMQRIELAAKTQSDTVSSLEGALVDVGDPKVLVSERTTYTNGIHATTETISERRRRYSELQQKRAALLLEERHPNRGLDIQLRSAQETHERAKDNLAVVQSQPEVVVPTIDQGQIQRRLMMCAKQRQWTSEKESLDQATWTLGVEGAVTEEILKSLIEQIAASSTQAMTQKQELLSDITRLKTELDLLVCPACSAGLKLKSGKLVHIEGAPDPDSVKTQIDHRKTQIEILDSNLSNFAVKSKKFSDVIGRMQRLGAAPLPKITSEEVLQNVESKLKDELSEYTSASVAKSTRDSKIQQAEHNLAEWRNKVEKLKSDLSRSDLRPIGVVVEESKSIDKEMSEIQTQIQQDNDLISAYKSEISRIDKLLATIDANQAMKGQYDAAVSKLNELQGQISLCNESYTATKRLKEVSDLAATEAVADILGAINTNVRKGLELLFPDQGTLIQILNEKENKDGKKKAQFSLKINHRGLEYGSLDEFSGGAENRVHLAFQLAIADLYKSPILLLDEPFAGVHESLRNECYQALAQIATDKLILVAEHGAPDTLFDTVIDF